MAEATASRKRHRPRRLSVSLTPEQGAELERLSKETGLPQSAVMQLAFSEWIKARGGVEATAMARTNR